MELTGTMGPWNSVLITPIPREGTETDETGNRVNAPMVKIDYPYSPRGDGNLIVDDTPLLVLDVK